MKLSEMSFEQKTVAIAEKNSWKFVKDSEDRWGYTPRIHIFKNDIEQNPNSKAYSWITALWDVPNYLCDLNAMHKAEKSLIGEQWTDYLNTLYYLTYVPGSDRDKQAVCATAEERGDAFLIATRVAEL